MKPLHASLIMLALGIAVVASSFAALRTTHLGASATATRVSSTQIAQQQSALTRAEAALRVELRKRPPAIGPLPSAALPLAVSHPAGRPAPAPPATAPLPAVGVPAAAMPVATQPGAPPAATQTVIYHRPPPIVHVIHRPGGGEHESEAPQGGSSRSNGGTDD